MSENPIIIKIPLTKYLSQIAKDWTTPYVTKTFGGQVWLSDENPGQCFADEKPNYIEFNDSSVFFRLPKEVHQHIGLDPGCHKTLAVVLNEIKQRELEFERMEEQP